jgi:hypothetical protein
VEVDDAVGEGFGGEKFEADGAVTRLDQGDAFSDEDGALQPQEKKDAGLPDANRRDPHKPGKARRYITPVPSADPSTPLRAGALG